MADRQQCLFNEKTTQVRVEKVPENGLCWIVQLEGFPLSILHKESILEERTGSQMEQSGNNFTDVGSETRYCRVYIPICIDDRNPDME